MYKIYRIKKKHKNTIKKKLINIKIYKNMYKKQNM